MKSNQTKNNSKEFRATDSEFWKKQHGYDDKKAEKASDWMSRHYSDLEEESDDNKNDNNLKKVVKLNESILKQIVAECLNGVMGINEVGETTVGQKRLGALSAKREKQAERLKSYLKEECDTQELCNMINQIFKSVRLKYRMQEYEEVFKTAINNGCSKQDLIAAFDKCNLDCTTNPRSKNRFEEIWASCGGQ